MIKEKKDANTIFRFTSWANGYKQKNIQKLDDYGFDHFFFFCQKTKRG